MMNITIGPRVEMDKTTRSLEGTGQRIDMEKLAQNIQEAFLNNARKDKTFLTIYLMSGVKLSGRIKSFDKYSVVLETNNQEQLIFKHAISTVAVAKSGHAYSERPRMVTSTPDAGADTGEAPIASGTEG
jgi:host factor-I protein